MVFFKVPVIILLIVLFLVNSAFWLALGITGFVLLGPVGLYCLGIMVGTDEGIVGCVQHICQM